MTTYDAWMNPFVFWFVLFCFLGPSSSSSRKTLRIESSETRCSPTNALDFTSCQSQSPKSSHLPPLVVKSGKILGKDPDHKPRGSPVSHTDEAAGSSVRERVRRGDRSSMGMIS